MSPCYVREGKKCSQTTSNTRTNTTPDLPSPSAGGLDTSQPEDDREHTQPRHHPPAALHRHPRLPQDLDPPRAAGDTGGPGPLHVPGEHGAHDQPAGVLTGGG